MKKLTILLSVSLMFLLTLSINATTYTSTATGNWSTMTWSPVGTPGLLDDVVIADGHTVTIDQNVSIANLTVGGGSSGILTFDATNFREVKVSGNVTVSTGGTFIVYNNTLTPTGDVTAASNVVTNVSSTAGISTFWNISGTGIAAGSTISGFDATTITMSLAATLTGTAVPLTIRPTLKDSIYIGGNLTNNGKFDMSLGSSTTVCNVIFNNTTGNQTISGTTTDTTRFRGVTLAKGAISNKVICSINVTMASTNITFVAGTWEQNAGRLTTTSGTIGIGTAAGTTFGFSITGSGSAKIASNINNWGTLFINTSDSVIVGTGPSKIDLTNAGGVATFKSGTVVVYGKFNLASNSKDTISGANIIIDPKGLTASDYAFRYTSNSGTNAFTFTSGTITILNANGAVGANPEFAMSSTTGANISGTALFVLGQGGSTIGSAQGFRISLNSAALLNHLTINTGTVDVTNQSNVTVKGTLTLTSGKVSIGGFSLTAGTISGGSSSGYVVMHQDSTGTLRRTYTSIGSTTFPIGDATNYSPCTIDVTSGSFASAYIGARVANKKHPNNTSTTDYLTRYWTLTSSGVSNLSYDASFNYVDADINGTESSIYGARYSNGWMLLTTVNSAINNFNASGMTAFGSFTGRSVEILSLTALIEGFYDGSSMVSDTVTVELRNSATYTLVDQAKVLLNSSGNGTANFFSAADATNYYIAVKHRNAVETWSANPQQFTGGTLSYDFTTASSKAYSDGVNTNLPMKQIGSKWCFWSGDVTHNYFIEYDDLLQTYNKYLLSLEDPGYWDEDVTGNEYVEFDDVLLVYNNYTLGIWSQNPMNPVLTARPIK
jgi:hypothetical protein